MSAPFVPEGAPRRPALPQFSKHIIAILLFIGVGFELQQHIGILLTLAIITPLILFTCSVIVSSWRYFNSTSWYELKPLEIPSFPFEVDGLNGPIVFEEERMLVNDTIFFARGRDVRRYEEIERVEVLCQGILFRGAELHLRDGKCIRLHNGYDSGEPCRTALALLRFKASGARFDGAPWIEQGYIPRFGFSFPNTD